MQFLIITNALCYMCFVILKLLGIPEIRCYVLLRMNYSRQHTEISY